MDIINLAVALFLFANSADLLYLYFVGAWYDPIKWIEYTEVAFEFILAIGALMIAVILLRRILRATTKASR